MNDKLEIIIVEQDDYFRDFLVRGFNRDSRFKVDGITDYQEAYERLKSNEYHMIAADGDKNKSYELAKKLRLENNNVPVLLYFDMLQLENLPDILNSRVNIVMGKPLDMTKMQRLAVDCIWRYFQRENSAFFEGKA